MRKSVFCYKRLWMVMIFKQFMTGYSCEMFIKFRFVVAIFFVLPFLGSSSNVRKRRRPTVDEQYKDLDGPFPDQIALATSFEPDHLVSASFSTSKQPGNFGHGNLVINLIKANSENEPKSSNIYLMDETLADSQSAQEYVTKALQLKLGIDPVKPITENNEIPKPTFAKYEVYETQTEETPEVIEKESVTRSGYNNMQYDEQTNNYHKPQYRYTTFTTETYPQIESKKYEPTSAKMRIKSYNDHQQESTNIVPKAEIFKHIEESVMKYMQALEADGKITKVIKEPQIYYKIQELPSEPHKTTTIRPKTNNNFNHTPLKLELQKPDTSTVRPQYKHSVYIEPDYREASQYKEVSYQPGKPMQDVIENLNQNIAFVYKKPTKTNLQNRGPANFDHSRAVKNMQSFDIPYVVLPEEKPVRAKLFFNSDTYRDINSLPFQAEKQLYRPVESKENEYMRPEHREISNYNQQEQSTSRPYLILKGDDDGYPLNNPYEYIYNQNQPQALQDVQKGNWHPYSPARPTYSQDLAPAPSALPYDSYNPKYNNNPEGDGYQHNYKPHEIYISPSLRQQKNENNSSKRGKRGGNLHKKGKTTNTQGRKNNEPKRILRPPPYKTKD